LVCFPQHLTWTRRSWLCLVPALGSQGPRQHHEDLSLRQSHHGHHVPARVFPPEGSQRCLLVPPDCPRL
jgi:hypothetical protein